MLSLNINHKIIQHENIAVQLMFNRKFLVVPFTYSPIEAGVSLSGSTVINTGVKFGTLGKSSAINKIKLGDWKHVSQSYKIKKKLFLH